MALASPMRLTGIIASGLHGYVFHKLAIDITFTPDLNFEDSGEPIGVTFAVVWLYTRKHTKGVRVKTRSQTQSDPYRIAVPQMKHRLPS